MSAQRIAGVLPLIRATQVDRLFDYKVPDELLAKVKFGTRVRIRFVGRLVDGIVISLSSEGSFKGKLAPISRVLSAYPSITTSLWELVEILATDYLCTKTDVLRLILPVRHVKTEEEFKKSIDAKFDEIATQSSKDIWSKYQYGPNFLNALAANKNPKAVAQILSTESLANYLLEPVNKILAAGKSILIVVSDYKKFNLITDFLNKFALSSRSIFYYSELGVSKRYQSFLEIITGKNKIIVGNRSAAFAPIADLGLIICLDDDSDNFYEQRYPYFSIRDVLKKRSFLEESAYLHLSYGRNLEIADYVARKELVDLNLPKVDFKVTLPKVIANGTIINAGNETDEYSHIPSWVFMNIREALEINLPVLIRVPRKGYLPSLSCANCFSKAICKFCNGLLAINQGNGVIFCSNCKRTFTEFTCINCGHHKLRATHKGVERVAEEIGKAFKNVPVYISGGKNIISKVPDKKCLVFSTPGAEPQVEGKYAGGIILDSYLQFLNTNLDAEVDIFNQWINFASLILPKKSGGIFGITIENTNKLIQYLLAGDLLGFINSNLKDRYKLKLPPATVVVAIEGFLEQVEEFKSKLDWLDNFSHFGPLPVEKDEELVREIVKIPKDIYTEYAVKLKLIFNEWALKKSKNTPSKHQIRLLVNPKDM